MCASLILSHLEFGNTFKNIFDVQCMKFRSKLLAEYFGTMFKLKKIKYKICFLPELSALVML